MGNPTIDQEMGIYEEEELKEARKKFDEALAELMKRVSEYDNGEASLRDVDNAIYKLIRYGKPRFAAQYMTEGSATDYVNTYKMNSDEFLSEDDKIDINNLDNDDKKTMFAVRTEMMKLWNSTSESPVQTDNRDIRYDTEFVDNNGINGGMMTVKSRMGLDENEVKKKINKLWICAPGSMEPISIRREGNKFTVRQNCSTMEMYADLHRQKMVAPKPPKGLFDGILNRLSKTFLGRPSKAFRDYARAMARYTCSQTLESYGKRNLGFMTIKAEHFPNIEGADATKVNAARVNLMSVLKEAGPANQMLWKNIWRRLNKGDTKVLDLLASKDSFKAVIRAVNTNDVCDIEFEKNRIIQSMIDIDASVDYIRSLSDKLNKLPEEERKSELDNIVSDKRRCFNHLKKTKAFEIINNTKTKPEKIAKYYTKDIYNAFKDALDNVDIHTSNGKQLNSRLANYTANELDNLYLAYAKVYVFSEQKSDKDERRRDRIVALAKVIEKNKPSNPLTSLREDIDKRAKDLILNEQSGAGAKVTEMYKNARKKVAGLFGDSIKSEAKNTNITNDNALRIIKETIKNNENFKLYGFDDKIAGFTGLFEEAIKSGDDTAAAKFAKNVAGWNGDDIYNLYLQYFERPETIEKCILNPNEAQLYASGKTEYTYSKEEWKHENKIDKSSEQLADKLEEIKQTEMNNDQPVKGNDESENVVVRVPGGPI